MIFFFKLQIHSFAREARFPKDKCANFWGYYQDRRILFPRLVTEWSLKLFSSEQNCFDDQMRESVKYKNTEHVEGVTRSDVRTVNKWPFQTPYLEIIWLSLLSLASASPPSPTPISHFPSCRTGISPGAKVTHNGLELKATLVTFLLDFGLDILGAGAGNLPIFCKNVSLDKCAPSVKIWLTRKLWEHITLTFSCIKGNVTIILLSSCQHLQKNDLF